MSSQSMGARIKELRTSRGWSLGRMAEKTGSSRGYLSLVESDERSPKHETLEKIAQALGVTVDELRSPDAQSQQEATGDPRLKDVSVNLLAIAELDPEEYELIVRQLADRRAKLERDRKEYRRAQRRRSQAPSEPG